MSTKGRPRCSATMRTTSAAPRRPSSIRISPRRLPWLRAVASASSISRLRQEPRLRQQRAERLAPGLGHPCGEQLAEDSVHPRQLQGETSIRLRRDIPSRGDGRCDFDRAHDVEPRTRTSAEFRQRAALVLEGRRRCAELGHLGPPSLWEPEHAVGVPLPSDAVNPDSTLAVLVSSPMRTSRAVPSCRDVTTTRYAVLTVPQVETVRRAVERPAEDRQAEPLTTSGSRRRATCTPSSRGWSSEAGDSAAPAPRGPERQLLRVTPKGDRLVRAWLEEPVPGDKDLFHLKVFYGGLQSRGSSLTGGVARSGKPRSRSSSPSPSTAGATTTSIPFSLTFGSGIERPPRHPLGRDD